MPILSGRPSFTRLVLPPNQDTPAVLDQDTLQTLLDHTFIASDIGVPLEREIGWVSPDNLLDAELAYDRVAYRDGSCAVLGLRVDTNKVTPEIRKAVRAQHERAARDANPHSDTLSRADRAEAKAQADAELATMLAEGRFRSPSMTEVLWSMPDRTVLLAAASSARVEALCDQWRATFSTGLIPQSAGTLALSYYEDKAATADFDDLRPTRFTPRPTGFMADADPLAGRSFGDDPDAPVVPWAAASPEPRDFLGNEFLLWLWWITQESEGLLTVRDPDTGNTTELAVALHTSVDVECAWGYTGKATVREHAGGTPAIRLPELALALATGKLPRKAGLHIAELSTSRAWSCTLQADRWAVSSVVLPPVDEPFETPREEREYRLNATLELDTLLRLAFRGFLDDRSSDRWPTVASRIRDWIAHNSPRRHATTQSTVETKPKSPVPEHATA